MDGQLPRPSSMQFGVVLFVLRVFKQSACQDGFMPSVDIRGCDNYVAAPLTTVTGYVILAGAFGHPMLVLRELLSFDRAIMLVLMCAP